MLSDTSLYEKQMSINVIGLKNDMKKLGNDINKATENSSKKTKNRDKERM